MSLIVGLGNPGEKYLRTRHNIGFRVVEAFASRYRLRFDTHEKNALTASGRVAGGAVTLAKPLTFMNISGRAVAPLSRLYIETLREMLVVFDDIDLPLGRIRIRESGSAGSHNGMKSIIEELGTEQFPRLRFGIRGEDYEPGEDLARYVLGEFSPQDEEIVEAGIRRSVEALFLFARGDLRRAMNEFNRDPAPENTESA
jgi:peptidyl-tRNA hydrolase, PTH1 family